MVTKILDQSQAEAVYSAMCHLNNVGGALSALIGGIRVEETHCGGVQVWALHTNSKPEHYANQSAFATAYGLQQG